MTLPLTFLDLSVGPFPRILAKYLHPLKRLMRHQSTNSSPRSADFASFSPPIGKSFALYSPIANLLSEPTVRIDRKKIEDLTRRKRITGQVAWFQEQFGICVPHDRYGIVMTEAALNKLLEKRLGILPSPENSAAQQPSVRLVKKDRA